MASVQQSLRNRDLYLRVIPNWLSKISFCLNHDPKAPTTKGFGLKEGLEGLVFVDFGDRRFVQGIIIIVERTGNVYY